MEIADLAVRPVLLPSRRMPTSSLPVGDGHTDCCTVVRATSRTDFIYVRTLLHIIQRAFCTSGRACDRPRGCSVMDLWSAVVVALASCKLFDATVPARRRHLVGYSAPSYDKNLLRWTRAYDIAVTRTDCAQCRPTRFNNQQSIYL